MPRGSLKREDVEAGRIDLADVRTGRRLKPVHPGRILTTEFLAPLGLTQYRLAKAAGLPLTRINQIAKGRRGVSAETALRLARYFGTTAAFWLALQARHDLEIAAARHGSRIAAEVRPLATAA